jgi:pyrimidine operon attenuation protein/uracil phosphoribosyltransferase
MPDSRDVNQLLGQMAHNLRSLLASRSVSDPLMIGIHTGGVWVAQALHSQLALSDPLGTLNISFYRDDFTRIGMHPQVQPSSLPFEIENHHVILVDDVLHTGRTIRAALNEIFDYGRPASVMLTCLVDRGGKELPVCADIVGERIELLSDQHIKLNGPEPLQLTVQSEK